jgi:hypothetical protein
VVRKRYGINICSDTRFREPAAHVAARGAQLLLAAAQNMLRRPVAEQSKDLHHSVRAERARATITRGLDGEAVIDQGPGRADDSRPVLAPRGFRLVG